MVYSRLLAAVAIAVLAGAAAVAWAGAGLARTRPALRVLTASPVSVRGSRFPAHDRVRVRLRVSGMVAATRRVRAGRRGRFTVTFAGMTADRCSSWSVTAVDRAGRRATVARRALAECPPL